MEEFVFGEMMLVPDVFYKMTPREVKKTINGYHKKQKEDYKRKVYYSYIAGIVSGSCFGGKPITYDELIGKED